MSWFRKRECVNAPYCDNPSNECDGSKCQFSNNEIFNKVLMKCGLPENTSINDYLKWDFEEWRKNDELV